MRFAIVGSGAVGGYYGAKLAQAGYDVTFIARGTHLAAIRERGLSIKSPLGDFIARARAEDDPSNVPPVDTAIFAVKAYSNRDALPLLKAIVRQDAVALTLQNGVDSVDEVAAAIGRSRVLGGSTYIATALESPGLIEQTGTNRRIVFGEVSGNASRLSGRVIAIHDAFTGAGIMSEPVPDARVAIWEKFCYLSPFAACTGAARAPIGPLRADPSTRGLLLGAFREVEAVAREEGVDLPPDVVDRIVTYVDAIPSSTRSSLLIDLQQDKPIEVEALIGTVVRRGARAGVPTPIMAAWYAVLKPQAYGRSQGLLRWAALSERKKEACMSTNTLADVLVNTEWVAQHATDVGIRVVEVDVDTTAYDQGHVPGAAGWNWTTDLCDTVIRDIAPKPALEALLGKSGIDNKTTIILYGDNNNWFAAWAFWQLKIYGHEDVRIMDGGRKKWLAEGRDLTNAQQAFPKTIYTTSDPDLSLRAFLPEVQEAMKSKQVGLVDVRSPQEFTGEILAPPGLPETCQRGGHIPGAKSIPWAKACNDDGTFKSYDDLKALYGAAGITEDRPVIAYCRIGERSSHTWFVLKYLLGFENVKNYDGSWTEWGNLVGAPVEKP